MNGRRVRRLRRGGLRLPSALGAWPLYVWRRGWRVDLMRLLLPGEGEVFVDVGANVGEALLDCYDVWPEGRYLGFEPNPDAWRVAQQVLDINECSGWRVINCGLGAAEARVTLHRSRRMVADKSATIRGDLRPQRESRGVEVAIRSFDNVRSELNVAVVSCVKIDVEGSELEVLQGMSSMLSRDRPRIVCEVLLRDKWASPVDYDERLGSLEALLANLRFDVYRVRKTRLGRLGGLEPVKTGFPREVWTRRRARENDYLFLSREDSLLPELEQAAHVP